VAGGIVRLIPFAERTESLQRFGLEHTARARALDRFRLGASPEDSLCSSQAVHGQWKFFRARRMIDLPGA